MDFSFFLLQIISSRGIVGNGKSSTTNHRGEFFMNRNVKIAFFDTKPYDRLSFDSMKGRYGFEIDYFESRLTPVSAKLAEGHEVVCAFVNDDISAETVEQLIQCGVKLIAMRCAGFNNVDLAAACHHLDVVRVPKYSPYAVAEYALGLMLASNRHICKATNRTREGNFSLTGLMGFDMHEKTIGIIGTGKIAKVLIQLLSGFGVHLLAYDIYPDEAFAKKYNVDSEPSNKSISFNRLYNQKYITIKLI